MIRPALLVGVLGVVGAWLEPEVFRFSSFFLQPLRDVAGWVFIAAGVGLYLWSSMRMVSAVRGGRLDTGGPYAVVRHPMYSAWIVFLLPGVTLVSGAWLVFGSSLVAWVFFEKWAPAEEQAMAERFGREYEDYKAVTPSLLPFGRMGKGTSG